jgi:hypothetical protein
VATYREEHGWVTALLRGYELTIAGAGRAEGGTTTDQTSSQHATRSAGARGDNVTSAPLTNVAGVKADPVASILHSRRPAEMASVATSVVVPSL